MSVDKTRPPTFEEWAKEAKRLPKDTILKLWWEKIEECCKYQLSTECNGNAAKLREALEYLCSISDLDLSELEALGNRLEDTSTYGGGLVLKLVHGVRNGQKALASPPRNCDVGTAKEQTDRYETFCASVHPSCVACKADSQYTKCEFVWAQMPYTESEVCQ